MRDKDIGVNGLDWGDLSDKWWKCSPEYEDLIWYAEEFWLYSICNSKVLNRKMTWLDLYFRKNILGAMWKMDWTLENAMIPKNGKRTTGQQ